MTLIRSEGYTGHIGYGMGTFSAYVFVCLSTHDLRALILQKTFRSKDLWGYRRWGTRTVEQCFWALKSWFPHPGGELEPAVYISNDELLSRPYGPVREGIAKDSSFPHMLCSIGHVPRIPLTGLLIPNKVGIPLSYICFGTVDCMVGKWGVGHDSLGL